jgi:hypothetical protein
LGELQTIRAGIVAGLTEWKNRKNSGMVDVVTRLDEEGDPITVNIVSAERSPGKLS